MKIHRILLFLGLFLTSLSVFPMHHENSYQFSDCQGEVGNLYISKMLETGSVSGFKQAVKQHQEFYNSRDLNVRVIPGIQYERNDQGTVEEIHSLTTMVIFPSKEDREEWRNRDFTEKDQKILEKKKGIRVLEKNNIGKHKKIILNLKEDLIPWVTDKLVKNGTKIFSIEPHNTTLEDVFLTETGDK